MEIEESADSKYSRSSKNLVKAGQQFLMQKQNKVASSPEKQTSAFELFKKPHRFGPAEDYDGYSSRALNG